MDGSEAASHQKKKRKEKIEKNNDFSFTHYIII
jgi:hypothetical protein